MKSDAYAGRRADWLAKSVKNREKELSSMNPRCISKDDARRCLGVTRSTFDRWMESGRYGIST